MADLMLAHDVRDPETRTGRAMILLDEHGEDAVQHVDGYVYLVIASDGESYYRCTYGDVEHCPCLDFSHRDPDPCKHLLALGIFLAREQMAAARRRRTFCCEGCGNRFPNRERFEVTEDNLTFFEGDSLCEECARNHGVL